MKGRQKCEKSGGREGDRQASITDETAETREETLNWRNSRKNAHTNKGERNNVENPVIERIRVCSGNGYVGRLNDPQLQFLLYHLSLPS